jgi:hypothetical protein
MPTPPGLRRVAYFAYGSNLDPEQMRRRCPDARSVGPATLRGFVLEFRGHSRTWGGGVANVRPKRGGLVRGLVYSLTIRDLARLDQFEGHPWQYARFAMKVEHRAGRASAAQVYAMVATDRPVSPPSDSYLSVLSRAYARLGFDPAALRRAVRRSRPAPP